MNCTKQSEGWIGDFADYPSGEDTFFELTYQHDALPTPLDTTDGALVLSGANRSDDLFMFIKREVKGLATNRRAAAIWWSLTTLPTMAGTLFTN